MGVPEGSWRPTGTVPTTGSRRAGGKFAPAHLRRDFQALVDRGGQSAEVGRALLEQAVGLFTLWHEARDGRLNRAQFQAQVRPVRRKVIELLGAGSRSTHRETRRTCANILKEEPSLWTFVRVEGVEPTNNAAPARVEARGVVAEEVLRDAAVWPAPDSSRGC